MQSPHMWVVSDYVVVDLDVAVAIPTHVGSVMARAIMARKMIAIPTHVGSVYCQQRFGGTVFCNPHTCG